MGVMVRVGVGKAKQAEARQIHYVPRGAGNTRRGARLTTYHNGSCGLMALFSLSLEFFWLQK